MQATFEAALRGLRMTGASVDTRDLVELIVRHGKEEGELLATYEQLVDSSDNETAAYVIGMILEDERRHHRLLAEVANAAAWTGPRVPPTTRPPRSRRASTVNCWPRRGSCWRRSGPTTGSSAGSGGSCIRSPTPRCGA